MQVFFSTSKRTDYDRPGKILEQGPVGP